MLAANAHAHGPVLYISPTTTTRPPRCQTQPRSRPSRRSSRSRTSTPSPTSHGIADHPANGHSNNAAEPMARPAAPRRVRVSRCQVKEGRDGGGAPSVEAARRGAPGRGAPAPPTAPGGGAPAPPAASSAGGTTGGADGLRATGSHGGGSGRGSIVREGYRRRVSIWWKLRWARDGVGPR